MSVEAREQRALAKAREQWGVGNRPMRLGSDREVYALYSRAAQRACVHCGAVLPPSADVYLVTVEPDGALACDCPSGAVGGICWHKAAVRHHRQRLRLRHGGCATVIDFSTLRPPPPPPEANGHDPEPFDAQLALFTTTIALALTFDLCNRRAATLIGLDDDWRISVIQAACLSGQALLLHHPPYIQAVADADAQ